MADFIDKAILVGIGLEKKIKELAVELEEKGRAIRGEGKETLSSVKKLENSIAEEVTKAVKEITSVLKEGRVRIEKDLGGAAESVTQKLGLATHEEFETVKEMARIAREQADRLEKRVAELEKRDQ